jgi:hypothetical protein
MLLVLTAAIGAGARRAHAYPQFQLATGNARCNLCHFAPGGGGLVNDWGRAESADTVSAGGDGSFLHGLVEEPSWLRLGGDLRLALAARSVPYEPEFVAFPMQADLYTRVSLGARLSLALSLGLRGAARRTDSPLPPLTSREHYLMWEGAGGWYARFGRYFPIYGLRPADHTAYIRRYLGLHTLEEPYAVSAGLFRGRWEGHLAAFTGGSAFLTAGSRGRGLTVYGERRLADERAAVGAQARLSLTGVDARYLVGGVGKWYFPGAELLLLGEVDAGLQTFAAAGSPSRAQLAVHLSAYHTPAQGWALGGTLERYAVDLVTGDTVRDALSLSLQYFVRAHIELMCLGKLEAVGAGYGEPTALFLLQGHYYL